MIEKSEKVGEAWKERRQEGFTDKREKETKSKKQSQRYKDSKKDPKHEK